MSSEGTEACQPKSGFDRCRFGKERRSFFPISLSHIPSRCLRLAAARQILSIGIALALLILSVPNASAQQFASRAPAKDISTSGLGLSNKNPRGIWVGVVDGQKVMLVLDARYKKIFSYCFDTGRRLDNHRNDRSKATKKDIEGDSNADGIYRHGEQGEDDKYGPTAGADGIRGNGDDGESDDQIIANADDFFLFKTNAPPAPERHLESEEARKRRQDPYRETNNQLLPNPYGIWSDGTTLWVSDFDDAKIYAYTLTWHQSTVNTNKIYAKGTRNSNEDITLNSWNRKPHGIWVHDDILWVVDNGVADSEGNRKIFAYNWLSKTHNSLKDIPLKHDTPYAQGIWSDGTTLWVANIAGSDSEHEQIIYAYDITSKARDPRKDFTALSGAGNDRPRGIWSDGETMWVVDQTDNKLYAYHAYLALTSRNEKQDFGALKAAGNDQPRGIWSDGETMWVTDNSKDKLYAYNLATKKRERDKEFTLKTSETDDKFPQSMWSDGETMWVAHFLWSGTESKLFAYDLDSKARDADEDFDTLLAAENKNPVGLWSNGTTMWVADSVDQKLYAYKMSDKSRDPSKDFNTLIDAENTNPKGLWSNGTTMWVADSMDQKLYAYKMSDKSRDADKDFGTLAAAGNEAPFGIWSDKATMWVLDSEDGNIYGYRLSNAASLGGLELTGHVPSKEYEDIEEVRLHPSYDSGTTWYRASVPYVTERLTLAPKTLRAIDQSTPGGVSYALFDASAEASTVLEDVDDERDGFQVDLAVGENSFEITVANGSGNSTDLPQIRSYKVVVNREFYTFNDPSKDIGLAKTSMDSPTSTELENNDNAHPRGVWADGTTLWVVDYADGKIYVYNKADGTRFSERIEGQTVYSKDFSLAKTSMDSPTPTESKNNDNAHPYGLWSDGTTMWVADSSDKKLYAYNLSGKTRFSETIDGETVYSKDISLDSNNSEPRWIWSDGVTMWVADSEEDKVYAYNLESKSPDPTKDIEFLTHLGGRVDNRAGLWSDGVTLWVADKGKDKIFAFKLKERKPEDTVNQIDCWEEAKDYNTLKAAGNEDPKGIYADGSIMWVVDSEKKKIFAYNQPLSENNNLKSLALSDVYEDGTSTLISEAFVRSRDDYSAYVVYSNAFTTVTAEAQDPGARVEVTQPARDADLATPGHQVNLAADTENGNQIIITVTAENGSQKNYTVIVTRKSRERTPIKDFHNGDFSMMNSAPTGLFGNATSANIAKNLWVGDEGQNKIYAYDLASKTKIAADGFNTLAAAGNTSPWGIWSDETTMWVTDYSGNKVYAYNMGGNKGQDTNKEIQLINSSKSTGLWSDGSTMWVASETFKEIYAYNMWTNNVQETPVWDGSRDRDEDLGFSTLNTADNKNPKGIWSDGTTMWVANGDPVSDDNIKIYAYTLSTEARDAAKDINNLKTQLKLGSRTEFKGGLWSDGVTLWVSVVHTDAKGRKLYAFNLPQPTARAGSGPSEDSTLKDLRLSGVTLTPAFSPAQTRYTAMVEHDAALTTVTAAPNDLEAAVEIFWASDETASRNTARRGSQVTLEEGYNVIVIDVEAANGRVETYFVEITKAEAPPVSGGPLPVFQAQAVGVGPFNGGHAESSSAGLGEGESRLIFAESLPNGGIRFVFLVPEEEFQMEETVDLLSGNWRLLPEDEFQAARESLGHGRDRLTVILPKAEGKQRFLRLTPLK